MCKEPRSYIITNKEGVQYRKPYQPQVKKVEDEHLSQNTHVQTVKTLSTMSDKSNNLAQSRPKRVIKPPVKLDL